MFQLFTVIFVIVSYTEIDILLHPSISFFVETPKKTKEHTGMISKIKTEANKLHCTHTTLTMEQLRYTIAPHFHKLTSNQSVSLILLNIPMYP